MKLVIRGGLQLVLPGAPVQQVGAAQPIRSVALLGADAPGVRAELLVAEGQRVAAGDALFRDRKRPELRFTTPVAGTVAAIDIGARRLLSVVKVTVDGNARKRFELPAGPGRAPLQSLLLDSGLWAALLARPFGRIPDPGSAADAIFVTALDTQPLAADAGVVLAGREDDFARGVACLKQLTDGPVFVCQAPGPPLVRDDGQIRCVEVAGAHPAGLVGTHVNRLFPLLGQRSVWQLHHQDAMALGALLRSGEVDGERIIALAGTGIRNPRLVRVPLGADLDDLLQGEMNAGPQQIVAGPLLAGRSGRYLGRHHWQVSVLPPPRSAALPGWLGRRLSQGLRDRLRNHLPPLKPPPVVATAALAQALAINLPVLPLLRALSVGDTETAARLGCRELLEEDMALLNYASGAAQDFGALLRAALDTLEAAR